MGEQAPSSLTAVVLKIAAPCNLLCGYCYEYNAGDESWRKKPKIISNEVIDALVYRILEHQKSFPNQKLSIVFHGGEPLLAGYSRLKCILSKMRTELPKDSVSLVMQTNGTLLTPKLVDLFREYGVLLGVSLDGGEHHNRARVDRRGLPSWERTAKGINIINERAPEIFGGILAVADLNSNPVDVLESLAKFSPPSIDFLQPFYNHDDAESSGAGTKFGEWFVAGLRHWLNSSSMKGIKIRTFSEVFLISAGLTTTSDWFGAPQPNYVVVETDGSYSLLDSLKTIGSNSEGLRNLSDSLLSISLEEALASSARILSEYGAFRLPSDCKNCEWETKCRGGYIATRYSAASNFDNPSIYCEGIKKVFGYCQQVLQTRTA